MATSETHLHKITNVPGFYLTNDVILMGANPLLGPLEGVGPSNYLPASKSLHPLPTFFHT
jgi:hypothetical protein